MKIAGFEWDIGNRDKNEIKHGVTGIECEEVFFQRPLIVAKDPRHSRSEKRLNVLGKTRSGRLLFLAFVMRNRNVRVISARPMSRREREIYEK
jgi:uncharacterized DUF497 family protein